MATFAPFGAITDVDGKSYKTVMKKEFREVFSTVYLASPIVFTILGDYIYSVTGTASKTISKVSLTTGEIIATSADYGGVISAITNDGTYVYATGATTLKLFKYDPSDMSKITEANVGTSYAINALCVAGDSIYSVSDSGRVFKYNLSDLVKTAENLDYGADITCVGADSTYLYIGGETVQKIFKLNLSDLVKVAESSVYGGNIIGMCVIGNYVYVSGAVIFDVKKYNTSDLALVLQSGSMGATVAVRGMTTDNTNIYLYVSAMKRVISFNAETLVKTNIDSELLFPEGVDLSVSTIHAYGEDIYFNDTSSTLGTKAIHKLSLVNTLVGYEEVV